jgi:glyoxalase family protein
MTTTIHPLTPPLGLHHVTALASDPVRNAEFYVRVLGLRLVKKTVNFDAPDVYHVYYGNATGEPGTLLTFFPFPDAARGRRGHGELSRVAFSVPADSIDFWINRLEKFGLSFSSPEPRMGNETVTLVDPDGLHLELVFTPESDSKQPWEGGTVPPEHAIRALFGVTMVVSDAKPSLSLLEVLGFEQGGSAQGQWRYSIGSGKGKVYLDVSQDPALGAPRQSAGSVHHVAWRVIDENSQKVWREQLAAQGLHVTEIVDRRYFRSMYFREPGGVLFEIATDGPGFLIDESADQLGSSLMLPPWLEGSRERIERALPPLTTSVSERQTAKLVT